MCAGTGLICTTAGAQDAVFSQFYTAPILLNPAFAGTTRAPSIALNHRSQYVGFASGIPYKTYSVSYGQYLQPLRSGIGLSIVADDAGDNLLATYEAKASYSYQVQIDPQQSIRIGLSAGFRHKRINWSRLVFYDQIDPVTGAIGPDGEPNPSLEEQPDKPNVTYPDFGAGVLYAGKLAYVGVSANHLTTPDDRIAAVGPGGFYTGYPILLSVQTGAQIPLDQNRANSKRFVTPNILYARQGPFEQLNLGAYVGFGQVFGGAWFRHTFGNADAIIGVVGFEYDMYKIGYSYDATVSELAGVSTGTHEVSLQLNFENAWFIKKRRQADRYNDCLQLFR